MFAKMLAKNSWFVVLVAASLATGTAMAKGGGRRWRW